MCVTREGCLRKILIIGRPRQPINNSVLTYLNMTVKKSLHINKNMMFNQINSIIR